MAGRNHGFSNRLRLMIIPNKITVTIKTLNATIHWLVSGFDGGGITRGVAVGRGVRVGRWVRVGVGVSVAVGVAVEVGSGVAVAVSSTGVGA